MALQDSCFLVEAGERSWVGTPRFLGHDLHADLVLLAAARGFSTASTASSAAIATASWERSGSRVVRRWSWMPGHIRTRAQRLVRFWPNHLISSKARPATIGMPTTREMNSQCQSSLPSGANTKMATIITISRKLVPQRGWKREKRCAFSGVSCWPAS